MSEPVPGSPVASQASAAIGLGRLKLAVAERRIEGAGRSERIEPRWMEVLAFLALRQGVLVTRGELLSAFWGAGAGDESLNRAIAGLRRVGTRFGAAGYRIETVRASGYILSTEHDRADDEHGSAVWDAWQRDSPWVDHAALEAAEAEARLHPGSAERLAMVALANRMATEVSEPKDRAAHLARCHSAARMALALEPGNAIARTALATVAPIFGDWTLRRERLAAILADHPDCAPAQHEMAILERSTGRLDAAVPYIEALLRRFEAAPTLLYKRIYHLWTLGRIEELDRLSDRAIQLWPSHMALVIARFWSLAFTGRPDRAEAHLEESEHAAAIPAPAMALFRVFLAALRDGGRDAALQADARARILGSGRMGPVQANSALIMLAGLGALDEAFEIAESYFLGQGSIVIGLQKADGEARITNQFRRGTQPLFIPSSEPMLRDPRFLPLMERIGLAAHWRDAGIVPDFLAA